MPVRISLLRAVNVGGRQVTKSQLVAVHEAAGCERPETLLASGNVVVDVSASNLRNLSHRIESEFLRIVGYRSEVILVSTEELREIVAANSFANRSDVVPSRLLLTFFAHAPDPQRIEQANQVDVAPEEMFLNGQAMYVYYPAGSGRSKFPAAKIARALGGIPGTSRNWNTVLKLLQAAERRAGS